MKEGPAITIGNFDGVHCGHQALLDACRNRAGVNGEAIALTFDPHPLAILRPGAAPGRLGTVAQRDRWLRDAGASQVIFLTPTNDLLSQSPETFIQQVVEQWRPATIVEGRNFRFGRGRSGSAGDLARLSSSLGFELHLIDPVEAVLTDHVQVPVSSSMIRWLLAHGRVADAAIMLGRSYEIETTVEPGRQRGRNLGFPTTNLMENGCLIPADGVYAGQAELPDGTIRIAAISIGTNPTFADAKRSCEAYLLDFDGWREEYGWPIRLRFNAWLRDQIVFRSADALKSQLARDVERIRATLAPVAPAVSA